MTQADLETEAFIRAALAEHFPADAVLGEEIGETPGTSGDRWIIDPIDGTKSFVHSVPLYANLIAFEEAGEITFGAINLPSAGVLVCAEKGACWRNGSPACVSRHAHLEYVMATWLEDWRPETIHELGGRGTILRAWGDAYGYAMVANGLAEAVLDPHHQGRRPRPDAGDHRGGRRISPASTGRPASTAATGLPPTVSCTTHSSPFYQPGLRLGS